MEYHLNNLASTYGSGAYDTNNYDGTSTGSATTTSGASPGTTKGVLTNTGFDLVLAMTLAATLIFIALVVRFWRRPKKVAPLTSSGD